MKINAKYFQSQRNLINAQLQQAKTSELFNDTERKTMIESYELQLKKLEEKENEYINNIEVEYEIVNE